MHSNAPEASFLAPSAFDFLRPNHVLWSFFCVFDPSVGACYRCVPSYSRIPAGILETFLPSAILMFGSDHVQAGAPTVMLTQTEARA